jgi:hypothetical protein
MYFNIAYLKGDRCLCVLNKANSAEEAREAFENRSPGLKIVSVWARPDFVPAQE